MSEWQDMSTAPKDATEWQHDRTRVLLTDGVRISIGQWADGAWTDESEIRWVGDDGAFHETWYPSHWQPLPEPPKPR